MPAAYAGLLAAVWACACVGKRRHIDAFEDYLRPLTHQAAGLVARAALVVEIALAVVLGISVTTSTTRVWAGGASAGFLMLATAMYAGLLTKGGEARCQCFGQRHARTTADAMWTPALLATRNWGLITLSLLVVPGVGARLAFLAGCIPMAIVAVALVSACLEQRRRLKREVHPLAKIYAPQTRILLAHTWWKDGKPKPL